MFVDYTQLYTIIDARLLRFSRTTLLLVIFRVCVSVGSGMWGCFQVRFSFSPNELRAFSATNNNLRRKLPYSVSQVVCSCVNESRVCSAISFRARFVMWMLKRDCGPAIRRPIIVRCGTHHLLYNLLFGPKATPHE